jgi:PPP family 3-phenylpropionic acid transporter
LRLSPVGGETGERLPYWRLSHFYFCYFAALGSFLPYWPVYLQTAGYSAAEIGQLMAILAGTKIVAPNLWGWLADRGNRMGVIRLATLLTVLGFAGVFRLHGYGWMAAILLFYSFFWNASLPAFEAVTLDYLARDTHRYGLVRLWGSVGFIAGVLGVGWTLERRGVQILPLLHFGLLVALGIGSLLVPGRTTDRPAAQEQTAFWPILRRPEVMAFLLVFFCVQLAHGPYYVFFTVHLQAHGYGSEQAGWLWTLGVLAEIVLFLVLGRSGNPGGGRRLLLWSLVLGALRWLIIAVRADSLPLLLLAQCLHAATFGVSHLAVMRIARQHFGIAHQSKGQALFNSVGYGIGGMLGSLGSGALWSGYGAGVVYGISALLFLAAFAAAWGWVGQPERTGRPR